MKSTYARRFFSYALLAWSLPLVLFGSVASAADYTDKGASVINCPSELPGLSMSFKTKYTPPRGWGHADAKGIKSKGGGHRDLSPVVLSHTVNSRNLICSYGYGSGDHEILVATIKKTMPLDVSCMAESEFRFRCVATSK
jgi:hypothetical protein